MNKDHKFLGMGHIPVLLQEVMELLNPQSGEFFIDGTLGGGGHAIEILKRIAPSGKFVGVDMDAQAILRFVEKVQKECRGILPETSFFITQSNYACIPDILEEKKMSKADGLIIDLGFSSYQIDDSERGFGFRIDGPLDMRYGGFGIKAEDVINTYSETEIANIIFRYGEERFSRRIASAINRARQKKKIETTRELAEIVLNAYPMRQKHRRIHPATKTFQALRIFVNNELENLETALKFLPIIMRKGGRVSIISFHSLEDRMVKEAFKNLKKLGYVEIMTKKPITPTLEEVEKNPRSRSAKLRVIQFI